MMPHNGSACQLEVPIWHLKFEVANCNVKVLGRPHLFEVADCDLKDSASSGVNRNMNLVLAAAYAAHPERFPGGLPSRRRARRKSGSTHPIPWCARAQYRVRGEYPAIRLAHEGTFA